MLEQLQRDPPVHGVIDPGTLYLQDLLHDLGVDQDVLRQQDAPPGQVTFEANSGLARKLSTPMCSASSMISSQLKLVRMITVVSLS